MNELSKYYSGEQLQLLLKKGVYPYEYVNSVERFNDTCLPPKEAFYSSLKGEGITDEDYEHAQCHTASRKYRAVQQGDNVRLFIVIKLLIITTVEWYRIYNALLIQLYTKCKC
jgi:hypothetical protein